MLWIEDHPKLPHQVSQAHLDKSLIQPAIPTTEPGEKCAKGKRPDSPKYLTEVISQKLLGFPLAEVELLKLQNLKRRRNSLLQK